RSRRASRPTTVPPPRKRRPGHALGSAALLLILLLGCTRREEHPPIFLISIDTLRADRVGGGTPRIKALARESIDCRNAWSHVPLTLPSHLSIFTGLLPPEHGVRDNAGYRFDPAHPTLASI